MKYLISVLGIVLMLSGLAFGQYDGDAYGEPDTSYQSTADEIDGSNNTSSDTGTEYYSKNDFGDFRHANWGMTKDQVRAIETAPIDIFTQNFVDSAAVSAFYYKGEYAGFGVTIEYNFTNDTLTSASYMFDIPEGVYAADEFNKIKATMDNDYWPAEFDDNNWAEYDNDSYTLEFAIAAGNADRNVQWNTDRSDITLGVYTSAIIMIEMGYWDHRQQ